MGKWVAEIEELTSFAVTQPQAAYAALTHIVMEQWNYFTCVIPDIGDLLAPLEKAIWDKLLPTITGRVAISDDERDLLALPVRLGGLGVPRADKRAQRRYQASLDITGPLVSAILGCSNGNLMAISSSQSKARVASRKEVRAIIEEEANVLWRRLPRKMKKAMELASEKGASAWLTTLPLAEEGFNLHKQAFRDALCLRYGWGPVSLPSTWSMDQPSQWSILSVALTALSPVSGMTE